MITTEEMPLTMPVPRWSSRGDRHRVYCGDVREVLRTLPDQSVHCCVTSPPYWGLRDYGVSGQIGQEKTPEEYVATMVEVFREVRRVLHDSGTVWLNVGDSYANNGVKDPSSVGGFTGARIRAGVKGTMDSRPREIPPGLKPKDLCLIPWRLAIALQADGWWVRSVICWAKKSCMPESVTDRPTNSWEPIFLLAKSAKYFYDAEAVRENTDAEPDVRLKASTFKKQRQIGSALGGDEVTSTVGRNQRNVWHLGPEPYADAHFATFPTEIPRRAIKAGTSARGCCPKCFEPWRRGTGNEWQPGCECDAGEPVKCTVLEPFLGSGTTSVVAHELGRDSIGIELSERYVDTLIVPRLQAATAQLTFDDML